LWADGKANVTISDNELINMTGTSFFDLFSFLLNENRECAIPGLHSILIENNKFTGFVVPKNAYAGSSFFIFDQRD